MCEWFDETSGQLLEYLEQKGLASNTLIVFVVDNGYIQRADEEGPDYERSKSSPYDGGIRTPIILRWPGRIEPRRDDQLVSSIDLVPTILRACGREPTPEMTGLNLLDSDALSKRKAIFGSIFTHSAADLSRPETSLKARWVIEGNWKLIVPGVAFIDDPDIDQLFELYDLKRDPYEQHDVAETHPALVERLHASIDSWWPAGSQLEN